METNPLYQPTIVPHKPLDKKVLVLMILGAVIFVLLIISIIVSANRSKIPINNTTPTPTNVPVTPTIEVKALPTQYLSITDQIDTELKTNLEFLPPQIDETIGQ